jgi:hypothetical protein
MSDMDTLGRCEGISYAEALGENAAYDYLKVNKMLCTQGRGSALGNIFN